MDKVEGKGLFATCACTCTGLALSVWFLVTLEGFKDPVTSDPKVQPVQPYSVVHRAIDLYEICMIYKVNMTEKVSDLLKANASMHAYFSVIRFPTFI